MSLTILLVFVKDACAAHLHWISDPATNFYVMTVGLEPFSRKVFLLIICVILTLPAQIYQSRSGCCHGLVPEDSTNKPINSNSNSLIRHIVFVTKSGKQRCKFKGNISELHDFVKFDLKINGSWSHARDPNHCIFKSNCKQITINFWQSNQAFTVCGKKEKEITKKL